MDTTEAAGIWGAVLNQLYKENIMVHALAKYGSPLTFADGVLTVGFDAAHAAQKKNLQAPISFNRLQNILSQVSPGTTLRLADGTGGPAAEADIARRGRNAHAHHAAPKNQDAADYRAATALEALIGYLYLIGEEDRLLTLFKHSQEVESHAQE